MEIISKSRNLNAIAKPNGLHVPQKAAPKIKMLYSIEKISFPTSLQHVTTRAVSLLKYLLSVVFVLINGFTLVCFLSRYNTKAIKLVRL